jgi:flagellar biosynthetic protein FliR
MDVYNFSPNDLFSFLLTFVRISLVVFMLPLFGADNVPRTIKGAICMVFTLAIFPHISFAGGLMPAATWQIVIMILSEFILGFTMGMVIRFTFAGIQSGGELLAMQMGFSMATVADPASGGQQTVLGHLLYTVAMLTFLALSGHLFLFKSLADTFQYIPPGGLVLTPFFVTEVLALSSGIFILAVKIAGPLVAVLFFIELTLALMARAAPQMNLLIIGFPLKIGVGFFFMGIIFLLISQHMREYILDLIPLMTNLLRSASPQ